MSEWISVKDKCPKCDEVVLIMRNDKKMFVATFDDYRDDLSCVRDFYLANIHFGDLLPHLLGRADIHGSGYDNITHWMPLPSPPGGK